jgi:hypothetical protein
LLRRETSECVIGDFGMSRQCKMNVKLNIFCSINIICLVAAQSGSTRTSGGPLRWMAPESLAGGTYSSARFVNVVVDD